MFWSCCSKLVPSERQQPTGDDCIFLLTLLSSPCRIHPLRYVLESGEFRLAAGPEQDCRLDSWATNPLCTSFELQLSDDYYPVCDYACGMWGPDSGDFTQRK